MGNKHVLHVSQPTAQGVLVVVADYVSLLVERGWRVSLVCPPVGDLAEDARERGATVLDWPARRSPGLSVATETVRLRHLIDGMNPDVVHAHSSKAGLDGRLALQGSRPTVFSPHAWSFFHGGRATRRAALAWERSAQRWTDAFVCGSDDELATGRKFGLQGPASVIPNTVSVGNATGLSQADARRTVAPDLANDVPLVVCVGRLVKQKGQDTLLKAWPQIRAAVPNAELALVGGGVDREWLAAMAGPGVRITGEVPRSEAFTWIRASDVVAAPSRWETMSLAVLEAVALGRPVVASDVEGMAQAVGSGAGLTVPVDDHSAFAHALVPYLNDREYAAEEGEYAMLRSQARWSRQMSDNGDALIDLYERVLRERSGLADTTIDLRSKVIDLNRRRIAS